jgi:hypothetical protein
MSDRRVIPASLWLRIVAFVTPGTFGRIELDVVDGRIVQLRLVETVKAGKGEDAENVAA